MIKKQDLENFIHEVEQKAYSQGIDFFMVTETGLTRTHNTKNDPNVINASESYKRFHKNITGGITFIDFYEYIQNARRNEYGYYMILPKSNNQWNVIRDDKWPKYYLHIYNGKTQVNICRQLIPGDPINPLAGFLFREHDREETLEVGLVKISNCIADYDHIHYFPAYSLFIEDESDWCKYLGPNGSTVKSILNDLLR